MPESSLKRYAAAVAFVAILSALMLGRLALIPLHAPLDYNEGWNAFQALNFNRYGNPYPDPGGLAANNYPPLSFAIVGWVGNHIGDLIVAGRLVALIALFAVALEIHLIIGRLVPETGSARWIGVGLFLALNLTVFRAYVGINDPQWLGHALMTGGLLVLLWRGGGARLPIPQALGSALLVAAGGLVKHNLVAVPLAGGIWLLVHDRRALGIWIGAAALVAGAVLIWDSVSFHGNMLPNIFGFPRTYSLARMLGHALVAIPLLSMMTVSARLRPRQDADRRVALLYWGGFISVVIAIIQGSGSGVDVNAWFEALIFLSIATPVALTKYDECMLRRRPHFWLAAPLVLAIPYGIYMMSTELMDRQSGLSATADITARIAQIDGPVACQTLALCYWAGKDFQMDFFVTEQRIARGHPEALISALDRRKLAALVIDAPAAAVKLSPLGNLIDERYRVGFFDAQHRIYVPK